MQERCARHLAATGMLALLLTACGGGGGGGGETSSKPESEVDGSALACTVGSATVPASAATTTTRDHELAPAITVTLPPWGSFVGTDCMLVTGGVSSSAGTQVTTTVYVAPGREPAALPIGPENYGVPVLQTTSETFRAAVPLKAGPSSAGLYTVTVESVTSGSAPSVRRTTIALATEASRLHVPFTTLPRAELRGVDNDFMLYAVREPWPAWSSLPPTPKVVQVIVRNLADGTEATLPGAASAIDRGFIFRGGILYASVPGSDCPGETCTYRWDPEGSRRNLSIESGLSANSGRLRDVKDDYLLWQRGFDGRTRVYTVYNFADRTSIDVAGIPDESPVRVDVVDGVAQVYFEVAGNIFRWDSASRTSRLVTAQPVSLGALSVADGLLASTSDAATHGIEPYGPLQHVWVTMPPASVATRLSSIGVRYTMGLQPGVLDFLEIPAFDSSRNTMYPVPSSFVLKAWTPEGVDVLHAGKFAEVLARNEGRIAWSTDHRSLHAWKREDRRSVMLADGVVPALSGSVQVSRGAVLFQLGALVYRVPF